VPFVTDTAPFRYPHYHKATDTPDKINYPEMAKVVEGLKFVVMDQAKISTPADPPNTPTKQNAVEPEATEKPTKNKLFKKKTIKNQ